MIYLSGCIYPIRHPLLGFMHTQQMANVVGDDYLWGADNGCFSAPHLYSDDKYLGWLSKQPGERCLFATAPDILADHAGTVERSLPLLPRLRSLGYKPAFVAQNGWKAGTTPWPEFDVLFIGGTDTFKLGIAADAIAWAHYYGKRVHMGRVNSFRRLRLAAALGCDSADGTYLKFGPDTNAPRLIRWLDSLHDLQFLPFSPLHPRAGASTPRTV